MLTEKAKDFIANLIVTSFVLGIVGLLVWGVVGAVRDGHGDTVLIVAGLVAGVVLLMWAFGRVGAQCRRDGDL